MKPGIPWSVKGVEPGLREVAKTAARRSGMTLGEWLGSAINVQADDIEEPLDYRPVSAARSTRAVSSQPHVSMDRAASTLEDIASQLSRLASRETEGSYRASPVVEDHFNYGKVLSRIESNEKQTVEAFSAVNDRLATISRQISRSQVPHVKPEAEGTLQSNDKVIRQVLESFEAAERRNRETIKALQDRMAEMSTKVSSSNSEQLLRQAPAFSQLESRLAEIARRVEQPSPQGPLTDQLRNEITQLASRIDSVRDSSEVLAHKAQTQAVQMAQGELRAIETRVVGLLNEAKQSISTNQVGPAEFQRFRQEIDRLHDRIDETYNSSASGQDVSALRQAVEQLSTRVAQGQDTKPIADLDRKIIEISQKLERAEAATRGLPQVSELEQRFADLDQRLAKSFASPSASDGEHIAQKLAEVDDRLAKTEDQLGHLETIERAVSMLYDAMEKNRNETQTLLQGANVANLSGLAGAAEITALEQGLQAVREASANSDQRNQETLEAVHETLEQIVGKLAELETAAIGQRVAQAASAPVANPALSPPLAAALTPPPVIGPLTAPPPVAKQGGNPFAAEPKKTERLFVPEGGDNFLAPAQKDSGNPFAGAPPTMAAPAVNAAPGGISDLVAAARRLHQAAATNSGELDNVVPQKSGKSKKSKGFGLPFGRGKSSDQDEGEGLPKAANSNDGSKRRLMVLALLVLGVASFAVSSKLAPKLNSPAANAPAKIEKTVQPTAPGAPAAKSSQIDTSQVPTSAQPIPMPQQQSDASGAIEESDPIVTGALPNAKQIPQDLANQVDDVELAKATVDATVGPFKLRKAAEKGDAQAQFIVATHYLEGDTVAIDYSKAAYWYGKAAASGSAPAQYRLGTLYERGKGVERDLKAALSWYERAGELGNIKAMHNAAVIAAGSDLGEPDYVKAQKWFTLAASHGVKDSQYNLAVLIERGLGAKQDQAEALFWYMAAAAQDDADAKARVGVLTKNLSAASVSAVKAKLRGWSPEKAPEAANVVAINDDEWNPVEDKAAELTPSNDIDAAKGMLQKMGYRVGIANGEMDARTSNAVKLFQIKQGLKVTGEITPDLLETLQSKVG